MKKLANDYKGHKFRVFISKSANHAEEKKTLNHHRSDEIGKSTDALLLYYCCGSVNYRLNYFISHVKEIFNFIAKKNTRAPKEIEHRVTDHRVNNLRSQDWFFLEIEEKEMVHKQTRKAAVVVAFFLVYLIKHFFEDRGQWERPVDISNFFHSQHKQLRFYFFRVLISSCSINLMTERKHDVSFRFHEDHAIFKFGW